MSRPRSCAPARLVDETDASVTAGTAASLVMQRVGYSEYTGRLVDIGGTQLANFGGCSYLGLEQRAELREGAIDAIRRYGTQFSFSRVYLESPLYGELESLLESMVEAPVLVTASTSLGHISALPVVIGPKDAVIVDRRTHASVHTAAVLLMAISRCVVPHQDLVLRADR